nr:MAG TPA: hypothetical protein [Caudoviricetes sp.]
MFPNYFLRKNFFVNPSFFSPFLKPLGLFIFYTNIILYLG